MNDSSWWQRIRSSRLRVLGLIAGIAGAFLAILVWLWPRQSEPPQARPAQATQAAQATRATVPAIYHLRVQVQDPSGRPIGGSTLRMSTGNEPRRLQNGWWKVEIPYAQVPPDGKVTIWAEHRAWEGGRVDLTLGADENPRAQVRLKTPESRIGGMVADAEGRGIADARVTAKGRAGGDAVTDQDGKFELTVAAPRGRRVRLRVEHSGFPPKDSNCQAGSEDCTVVLE